MAPILRSHNSAKNAITIRPVTASRIGFRIRQAGQIAGVVIRKAGRIVIGIRGTDPPIERVVREGCPL